MFIYVTMVQ